MNPVFPARLGYEAAGIINAVGKNVKSLKAGDAVSVIPPMSITRYGSYGELANFPAYHIVKHPDSLSWIEAAAIWMQYVTAYGALINIAKLTANDHVLITAASSSVGLAAIQIANAVGATPIAVTRSSAKKKQLQQAGATHVIASQEEDLVARVKTITNTRGATVAFDPVAGPELATIADEKPGVIVEDKKYSVAIHYRQAPHLGHEIRDEVSAICARFPSTAIEILPGKSVVEVKQPSYNKGTAVRELMRHEPFKGRRPIFIGDDVTDEAAFDVMPEFGGVACSVGREVQGIAGMFDAPDDVRRWLAEMVRTGPTAKPEKENA